MTTTTTTTTTHPSRSQSRIMVSVRRSISSVRRHPPPAPTDINNNQPATYFRDSPAAARPTVEQIAMGLHVSRTPHLRSARHHYSRSASTSPTQPLLRSSLKKSTLASSDSSPTLHPLPMSPSSSTLTSASLHTSHSPQPHHSTLSALKSRMARLLPGDKRRSANSSDVASAPPESTHKKKAVRFSHGSDDE